MGSTLARGLKEYITHKFSSLRPEDERLELYYSKKHEKGPLTPILRVIVHKVDRSHVRIPGQPAEFQRYMMALIYRDRVPEIVFETQWMYPMHDPMHDINKIMRGIQGAQAAFRRATKIGPLARLELIDLPTFRRVLTSDAPAFRSFLARRVKRELERRTRVTAAGAALRQSGYPRNAIELILRSMERDV